MKLVQSILTKNPCYTAGRKITVKGLMLHSVGCPQPKASVFINNWNSPSYDSACVHGFIDGNDGTVYQTLPWNHRGWHCGSGSKGSGNNTHIGVEMCEPACIRYTSGSNFTCSDLSTAKAVAKRTYEAAVEVVRHAVQAVQSESDRRWCDRQPPGGPQPWDCLQPWRSGASLERSGNGIYHGWIPQGSESGHGRKCGRRWFFFW